ncbi:MAG TPA: hypothetical protein VEG65_07170 [Candidatus Bathyarchaeia archaeon]|nr:hypothetical protein [Candidatus Bathyarchaeia archaeon]
MKQRIRIALAIAIVTAIAAVISYLWRVFRIGQASKNEAEMEESSRSLK